MSQEIQVVKISEIRENPVALRAVDKETEKYIGLRDSIASVGLITAISLRRKEENVDGDIIAYYELIDGLHRYSASKDAGLQEIPAVIMTLDDAAVQEAQIMANAHRIDTKPVEYTRGMNRLLASNPTWTIADLAGRLCMSGSWVSQRLNLLKLDESIAKLVDDLKITLVNAIALAKLPREEQLNFVDQAMTMPAEEFVPTAQARVKALRDAQREGRKAEKAVFTPIARLQKMAEFKNELETPQVGPQLIRANKVKKVEDAFALAVAWAINLDPSSVEVQKAKAEAKAAHLADEKKKRADDRAKKKVEDAQQEAAKTAAALVN